MHDLLTQLLRKFHSEVEGELREEGERQESKSRAHQTGRVTMGNRSIDDGPDGPGQHGQLNAPRENAHQQPSGACGIRTQVSEQTPDEPEGQWCLFPILEFIHWLGLPGSFEHITIHDASDSLAVDVI